ncbi:SDR family oxidoreductase [Swingsia samuiensis]|uniref:SDR family oxidoreductase n=1 Tax=Swingsia samuiensis TaxID=1293412 RepID=A0A4Y6UJI2_9PROT|nr:SDR family oxidoreductase [Swingsia samuiensis]QDH16626.1 SDR family oxidoreductase [Swingsia samuiensis]
MISPKVPRVAVVTGGAKRIGRALVHMLHEQGFLVAIHYRDSAEEAQALLDVIRGKGMLIQADLAHEDQVEGLIENVNRHLGEVGILINNASSFVRDEMGHVTREGWDRHLEPNLRAPFVLSQAFQRQLSEEAEGLILNMLDQRVWNLTPHFISYTVSKSALWTLTQTLALALAPHIRVNGIGPGPVVPAPGQSQEHFENMCLTTPLQHGSSPEEVAQAALALFSLPSVTGQMLALDGGQHLNWAPSSP